MTVGEGVTAAEVKSAAPVSITQGDPVPESPITDTRVPEISVEYRGIRIDNVLIDGGAGVNIVTKTTCERFGWLDWLPVPFLVLMADQRRVRPLGILRNLVLSIGGISFEMVFVVMNMEDAEEEYSMLLGRPWLRPPQLGIQPAYHSQRKAQSASPIAGKETITECGLASGGGNSEYDRWI